MSWEHDLFALFDDLEGQAAAAWEADREAELADRARAEYGSVTLASRLMASRGREVALDLPHVGRVEGSLDRVGDGLVPAQRRRSGLDRAARPPSRPCTAPAGARSPRWRGHRSTGSACARPCAGWPTPTSAAWSTSPTAPATRRTCTGSAPTSSRRAGAPAERLLLPYAALVAVQRRED